MDGNNYFTILAGLMTNLSQGSITNTSASSADRPNIDSAYVTHPAEVEIAIAAFKRVREIWDQAGSITIGQKYYPGRHAVQTDEQIYEFIKQNLARVWHASGTCAMGKGGVMDVVPANAESSVPRH